MYEWIWFPPLPSLVVSESAWDGDVFVRLHSPISNPHSKRNCAVSHCARAHVRWALPDTPPACCCSYYYYTVAQWLYLVHVYGSPIYHSGSICLQCVPTLILWHLQSQKLVFSHFSFFWNNAYFQRKWQITTILFFGIFPSPFLIIKEPTFVTQKPNGTFSRTPFHICVYIPQIPQINNSTKTFPTPSHMKAFTFHRTTKS